MPFDVADRPYVPRHLATPGEQTVRLAVSPAAPATEYRATSLADDHAKTRVIRLGQFLAAQVRAVWGL